MITIYEDFGYLSLNNASKPDPSPSPLITAFSFGDINISPNSRAGSTPFHSRCSGSRGGQWMVASVFALSILLS